VLAGALVGERPLDARAVGGLSTVIVSPAHGKAAAPFLVTYAISPCQAASGLTITFSWGALAPAGQLLGTAATDSACRATLSTTPPVNPATHQPPAPGNYQVFGYVALPTGGPTPGTQASASYTVDITATPTSTAHPSATGTPSASASGTTGASPSVSVPAASDHPMTAATIGAGKLAAARPIGQPGWWTLAWPLVAGVVVLALALLALMAFLVAWMRRRRRASR
jgi:hypothetical protein